MDDSAAEQKLNKASSKVVKKREAETAYIPGGSMFPAVLLNGMDAPTSSVSQKNPTPVLLRVKKEAVLPNFASLDVRECFVMGAGFGQLASERALIRTESISCVRHDGKVFDTKLEAYVVGTDGKVGVPGRLVSKQGQMIAQSLLAGALGGIGQSLTSSKIPALNINPANGQSLYDQESMASVAQSGFAGGLSSATNMIAKFYLDMAKETFPVVETQAGQVATVIVTRGMTLPLKGSTSLEQYVEPGKTRGGISKGNGEEEDGPRPVSTTTHPGTPAPVVGQHQVPVSIPGVNAATPKANNKLQW
jgi:conjugal transfer pilus assembly protein TraB